MQPAGQDPEARLVPGTVILPLRSRTNASPFWIMLLLVWGRLDNGIIPFWQLGLRIGGVTWLARIILSHGSTAHGQGCNNGISHRDYTHGHHPFLPSFR